MMTKIRNKISVLTAYVRDRLYGIIIYITFTFIYFILHILNHLPFSYFQYSFLLSMTVVLLFFYIDFRGYLKRHQKLMEMIDQDIFSRQELPDAKKLIERDYQRLLMSLYENQTELLSKADRKSTEMMEYFTLWTHQIKVPISAMRLLLQIKEDSLQREEIRKELFKIEQYVEMVLQYSRMECMSQDLILREHDLYELVKQAVKKYSLLFIYNKIKLRLEDFTCRVITDEKWLVFVLEQIISNAVKYTKTGSISIYMDSAAPKTLVIEDTGIGIEKEDLHRIFEKGFTGYNGRLDKKSTGLGLYLSREILTKLAHSIRITSEAGKGTKVYIDLHRESWE